MPKDLWPIFQVKRHLLHDLPALAAAVIQGWVKLEYRARVLVLVMPHTFGAHLNFNCHLHILASAGGLKESEGQWVELAYSKHPLMMMWKYAVITYLRARTSATVMLLLGQKKRSRPQSPSWRSLIRAVIERTRC